MNTWDFVAKFCFSDQTKLLVLLSSGGMVCDAMSFECRHRNRANPSLEISQNSGTRVHNLFVWIVVDVWVDREREKREEASERERRGERSSWWSQCVNCLLRATRSSNTVAHSVLLLSLLFAYFKPTFAHFVSVLFFIFSVFDKRQAFPYRFKVCFSLLSDVWRLVHSFYCFL